MALPADGNKIRTFLFRRAATNGAIATKSELWAFLCRPVAVLVFVSRPKSSWEPYCNKIRTFRGNMLARFWPSRPLLQQNPNISLCLSVPEGIQAWVESHSIRQSGCF
jgi:hypothetical protein